MEHVYKEMLRGLLKKKYKEIKKKKRSTPHDSGKVELILELYDYLGLGDIEDKTPTADQIMIEMWRRAH